MKYFNFERMKFPALTFLLSFAVLFYFFHTVLLSPNSYLFASGGDGIKNYYTYMFHAKHDSSFWEFTGMNYPYYENVIYTDGHPLFSYLIRSVGLQSYGVGILNFLLLLSFPICSVFLFLILRNYKVEKLWAIVAAIAITFLTPQIFRLTGHLSLSYVFAIPAMWWLLIKCNNSKSPGIWAVISFLYVFAFFFTHPYLGIILSFFCLAFWFLVYVSDRSQWKTAMGFVTVQLIVPFTLLRLLIFSFDDHFNRMDIPAGFYTYYAGWGSVLLPHDGPSSDVARAIGFRFNNWESWAYIGMTTIFFFLTIIIYSYIKRKSLAFKLIFKHELFLFFLAAVLILIFSFCWPFKFTWFRWITDSIGPLKQFRVLGRFTWVFYYVFTLTTIITFFHLYRKQGKHIALGVFFGIGMVYYFVESYSLNVKIANLISQSDNVFIEDKASADNLDIADYLVNNDYDAFIFLPFTHMSSENMMILGKEEANFDSFVLSYYSGLPMLNSVSSRLSQDESIKFNNFFGPEFVEKELVYDIDEHAKIAIVTNENYLNMNELRMMYSHEYTYQNESFSVCTFDRHSWNTTFYYDQVKKEEQEAKISLKDGWNSTADNWFYYDSWDEQKGESLKGKGAYANTKGNYPILADFSTDSLKNGKYMASFWYNHKVDRADIIGVVELGLDSDSSYWAATSSIAQSTHIVGHWMLSTLEFEITDKVQNVKIFLSGNDSGEPYIIDELLVRRIEDPSLFNRAKMGGTNYTIYNNYWLREDSFSE
ncbi:MAG: hypothetical protein MK066_08475 [Crocinitomicaceae bacterium]|nr:hypothetical protein [Crocinitomicaceae bacterium]